MKIKIYKKFELAKLYFPEQSKHVALNHLMRMVNHCPPLLEALRREGYERLAKTFTMRQTLSSMSIWASHNTEFSSFMPHRIPISPLSYRSLF